MSDEITAEIEALVEEGPTTAGICPKTKMTGEANMDSDVELIGEEDLRRLLAGDRFTENRLAESFLAIAKERCHDSIAKSRPSDFDYHVRVGKKRKVSEHAWDSDFHSAVGLAIARGFKEWKQRSHDTLNPDAFVSYVLNCVDTAIADAWREKGKWRRLRKDKPARKLRRRNPEFVAMIEDAGYEPDDSAAKREVFDRFVEDLTDDERAVLYSESSITTTAQSLRTSEYHVKKVRRTLRRKAETSEFLAV